MLNHYAK